MNRKMYCKFNNSKSKSLKICILILLLILTLIFGFSDMSVNADTDTQDIENEISSNVKDIVDGIDFVELDSLVDGLGTINVFDTPVKEKVLSILSGEYFSDYPSLISGIISLTFGDIRRFLPLLFTILAIGVLSNLIGEFKTDNSSANDVVCFVTFSVLVVTILFVFKDILQLTSNTITSLSKQMQIVFPLLITMLSAVGSISSVSIYNPLVAVLTSIVNVVFEKFLYPVFIVLFLLTIVGNLTTNIKLDKLRGFLGSSFKWVVGMVFTLFAGFLSIQGISAGRFDSVSIKATKFAVKSYIPIIGSYISDGMDFLVLGSVLVKNTIGLVGIFILFLSIISPILTILALKLVLQLSSGVLEMCGNNRMSNFLSSCSKILIYPIVIILGVAFMYLITITLIMCTANIF